MHRLGLYRTAKGFDFSAAHLSVKRDKDEIAVFLILDMHVYITLCDAGPPNIKTTLSQRFVFKWNCNCYFNGSG